jgi:hypothetical protein
MRYTPQSIAFTAMAILVGAAPVAAQECIGISSNARGYFTYGLEGTDGATGEGFTLGVRVGSGSLQLQRRTLEPTSVIDDIESLQAQVTVPVAKKVPVCIIAGIGWTGYDTGEIFSWSTDGEGNTTQSGRAGGPYMQLRVPVGIAIGKEFKFTQRLAFAPFASNSFMYDYERFESVQLDRQMHEHGIGMVSAVGFSLSYGRFMLRPSLTNIADLNGSFDRYNDFPFLSLQLGVKF